MQNLKHAVCIQNDNNFKFKASIVLKHTENTPREAIIIGLILHFKADFPWKVSLKILNSGIILKTFTHGVRELDFGLKGCLFETHSRHCVLSLIKTLYPVLSTGSNQEDISA